MVSNILDRLETKHKTRYGVIDYVGRKQVIFYDFTHMEDNPIIRMILIAWHTSDHKRFSIFCHMEFPDFHLPEPKILSCNSIQNKEDFDLSPDRPKVKKRKA